MVGPSYSWAVKTFFFGANFASFQFNLISDCLLLQSLWLISLLLSPFEHVWKKLVHEFTFPIATLNEAFLSHSFGVNFVAVGSAIKLNIVSKMSKFADATKLCHRARNPDDIMEPHQ